MTDGAPSAELCSAAKTVFAMPPCAASVAFAEQAVPQTLTGWNRGMNRAWRAQGMGFGAMEG